MHFINKQTKGGYMLFGRANGGLQEGACQGLLPRTSAASVLVPVVSYSHPPASAADPPTLAAMWLTGSWCSGLMSGLSL